MSSLFQNHWKVCIINSHQRDSPVHYGEDVAKLELLLPLHLLYDDLHLLPDKMQQDDSFLKETFWFKQICQITVLTVHKCHKTSWQALFITLLDTSKCQFEVQFSLHKYPKPSWQWFRPHQNQANACLNWGNSSTGLPLPQLLWPGLAKLGWGGE